MVALTRWSACGDDLRNGQRSVGSCDARGRISKSQAETCFSPVELSDGLVKFDAHRDAELPSAPKKVALDVYKEILER